MQDPIPQQTQQISDKPTRLLFIVGIPMALLIVTAVGIYTWLYLYGPCGVNQVQSASSQLLEQVSAFGAAYQAAPDITPVALIGPVMQLQQTLMDTREVVVPACMQAARNELVSSMESAIRALLATMESKPEATITGLMEQSTAQLDNFMTEMEAVNKCAPLCR